MTNHLSRYLRLWNLSDPDLLAQTRTSDVYAAHQNGAKVVLKLLTPAGVNDEQGGIVALRYFDGRGAVRLLAHDEEALLLEYAGDEELTQMVWRGDDLAAAEIIAEVLNKLHRPQPDVSIPHLRTLRRQFRELFRKAARDGAAGESSIYVRGARAAERLLANPRDERVLHGDIQHYNIRLHPVRGWLAYDPKGLYGERTYDAANTLCNPIHAHDLVISGERLLQVSQVLADGLGVHVGRLRTFVFAYACLSAAWFGDDDNSDIKQQTLTVARNAEQIADFSA